MSIILFCQGRKGTAPQSIVTASLQAAIEMAVKQKSRLLIYFSNTMNSAEIARYQQQAMQILASFEHAPTFCLFSRLDELLMADDQQVILLLFPTIEQAEQLCTRRVKPSHIFIAEDTQGKQQLTRLQIDYSTSKVCVI